VAIASNPDDVQVRGTPRSRDAGATLRRWRWRRDRLGDIVQELSVTIGGYLPRPAARAGAPPWTGMLDANGQSRFHAAVSRRYFALLPRRRSA